MAKSLYKKFKKGFTLIELIVVLGIIVIVSALTIPAFDFLLGTRNFTNAADSFLTDVRLVRNKALAASTDSLTLPSNIQNRVEKWIIDFDCGEDTDTEYTIKFELESSTPTSPDDEIRTLTLQNNTYFGPAASCPTGGESDGNQVLFNRLNGFPDDAVVIPITDGDNEALIRISNRGNIELEIL